MSAEARLEYLASCEWEDYGAIGDWNHVAIAMHGARMVMDRADPARDAADLLYGIATRRRNELTFVEEQE